MNLDQNTIGAIAAAIGTLAFIPYTISIFKGNVPSKASWIIWSIVGTAIALSYRTAGAKATLWGPISYAICPIVVLCIIFRKNPKKEKWPSIDRACLWIGISLFIPWIIFVGLEYFDALPAWGKVLPRITLFGGIAVDAAGALPTIWKTWKKPWSEDFWGWTLWSIANLLNLFAVEKWTWDIATYPIYIAIPTFLIFPVLLRHRIKNKKNSRYPATAADP